MFLISEIWKQIYQIFKAIPDKLCGLKSCGCEQKRKAAEASRTHGLAGTKSCMASRSANRKAKKLGIEGRLTAPEAKEILESCGGYCYYCGNKPEVMSLDHVVPFARGGSNIKENCKPACLKCNKQKKDRPLSEFLKELELA